MQLAFIKLNQFQTNCSYSKEVCIRINPSGRISSAYGYSQALDGTWKEYKKALEIDTIEDPICTQQTLSDGMWTRQIGR